MRKYIPTFESFVSKSTDTNESLVDSIDDIESALLEEIPYVSIKKSMDNDLYVSISFDPEESWFNSYIQNSNNATIVIFSDGTMESPNQRITKMDDSKIKTKFIKTKYKDVNDAIAKILKYIKAVKTELKADVTDVAKKVSIDDLKGVLRDMEQYNRKDGYIAHDNSGQLRFFDSDPSFGGAYVTIDDIKGYIKNYK